MSLLLCRALFFRQQRKFDQIWIAIKFASIELLNQIVEGFLCFFIKRCTPLRFPQRVNPGDVGMQLTHLGRDIGRNPVADGIGQFFKDHFAHAGAIGTSIQNFSRAYGRR